MKKVTLNFILISLIFFSCAEEPKIKLFNPEAFAFTLDNGWEINATVNAKGFAQIEKEKSDLYFFNLYYVVNLYTPQETLLEVDFDSYIDSTTEEIMDTQIDTQIELDSGFTSGNYTLEFIVEDKYSSTKDTISVEVVLQ